MVLNVGCMSFKGAYVSFPALFLHSVFYSGFLHHVIVKWYCSCAHRYSHKLTPPTVKTAFSLPCRCLCAQILRHVLFSRWISLQLLQFWCDFFPPALTKHICTYWPEVLEEQLSQACPLKKNVKCATRTFFWSEGTFATCLCSVLSYFLLLKLFSLFFFFFSSLRNILFIMWYCVAFP